jgi:hypothetical protein
MKLHRLAWSGCAWAARGAWTLAVWTLWLVLCVLIAFQAHVASTRRLDAPAFVLHSLEKRLAASGMHATFGRTTFDPSGRILFENVKVSLPGFEDPIVEARAVFVRLDPWALVRGRFEAAELRATGVTLRVPAMVSSTGQADDVIRDLDAGFSPREAEFGIEYLNFKLGGVRVSAHGAVHLAPPAKTAAGSLPLADFLSHDYATLSRKFDDAIETLSALDQPLLRVELEPSEASGAIANVSLFADGLRISAPIEVRARSLRLSGRFPFAAPPGAPLPAELDFAASELDLPRRAVARGIRARLAIVLQPGRLRVDTGSFRDIDVEAARVTADGIAVEEPFVSLSAGPLPGLRVHARGVVAGSPVSVQSEVDLRAGTARVAFDGSFAPGLMEPVGRILRRDLSRYAQLTGPVALSGFARFGPGWSFQRVTARIDARKLTVWHVPLDEARGRVLFDGKRLLAPEAFLRLGDSFARGTYEQDVASREYRLLLTGALRPPTIGPWFPAQSWWHEFFQPFEFPAAPPAAKVDVRGSWISGHKAVVFVAVDSAQPVFRGVRFDRVRTRLFIGPGFDDGLDFSASAGARAASGTFSRRYDVATGAWRDVDFDLASTFDLDSARKVLGPKAASILDPYEFDRAPVARVTVHLQGPADSSGPPDTAHVVASSEAPFRFHDFPFTSVSFTADMRGDSVAITGVTAGLAGGVVTGGGTIAGRGAGQRIAFNGAIAGASLGGTIAAAEAFFAKRAKTPPADPGKFMKAKSSVRLDLAASGEGPADNFLDFHGGGKARIQGAELGELRILGMLSPLLPFTSLRFTSARADFKLNGPVLEFPDVSVSGANSAIQAHGSYSLDRRQLDFKAKFFPFQKSKTLPQVLIGSVLSPLSEFLEVKLTGSVENPSWEFERGPTNILQKLSAPSAGK